MNKRTISGALLLVLVWESSALAQGLLPSAAGGWMGGRATVVAAGQLESIESVGSGHADLLREYGLISAEQRGYAQNQSTASIRLYRMVDPSAAYGAFTLLRGREMQPLSLGDSVSFSAAARDSVLLVVGNLLLTIEASDQIPSNDVLSEIAATLLPHADARPYPSIARYLPRSSVAPAAPGSGASARSPASGTGLTIVPGSERYVLGPRALRAALGFRSPDTGDDWIGFSKSAEAVSAGYRGAGQSPDQDVTLLISIYPTQQLAASQFADLGKWMALNVDPDQAGGRRVVYGTRSGALVALVFGAGSQDTAHQLIDQIQYRTSVTWNEPSQSYTDPSFPVMIIGVFEGTGLILLMAFAAGLGFGGLRLMVKILLPGRVFDRDSQVEILQLGLSSKPIDSRDFY